MMSLATLIVFPYLAFVFFGEGLNPFTKPRPPQLRARFRYGRIMALTVFGGWLCTQILIYSMGTSIRVAIATGIVVAIVLSLCCSVRRIGESLRH